MDHFSYDSRGDRLFLAALGNDTVEVVDLKLGKVVHSIAGLSEPQGLFYLPKLDRIYVANGGDGTLRAFNGTSYAPTDSQVLGADADNVRYDDASGQVLVGFGGGGLAFVNADTGARVGEVALDAHPESFELAKESSRVFVNVPGTHQIAIVDRRQLRVVSKWQTGSAGANFPVALDESGHRLFVGCRSPASLLVVDADSGKLIETLILDGDCDDLFFDAASRRIFASCGRGFLDVFVGTGGDTYASGGRIATVPGARTCFVDGKHLFLAVPRRGSECAAIWCYRLQP